MALENKLGITESAELAREEERISKTRAVELYEKGILRMKSGNLQVWQESINIFLAKSMHLQGR